MKGKILLSDKSTRFDAASLWLARLGGLGRVAWMPGTIATAAVGVPSALLLSFVPEPWSYAMLGALFYIACYACGQAEKQIEGTDPSEIVMDELAGFWVAMIGLPISIVTVVAGFLFFRLFDILKPWPIQVLDRQLHGGLGIVLDDVAAGVYAHAAVWLTCWWLS